MVDIPDLGFLKILTGSGLLKIKQRISRWLAYQLAMLIVKIVGLFPSSWNLKLGKLGWLAFWVVPRERKKALQSLNIALGKELSPRERKQIAIGTFQHLGRCFFEWVELFYYRRLNWADYVSIEGREHLDQGLELGKGVIFISAHLGNWELMAPYVALLGYPVNIIARRINNQGIDDLMLKLRRQTGVNVIMREQRSKVSKSVIKVLLKNEVLGILMDQDARVDGVFVAFFGRPAHTPSGPVALALATGAAIIPAFIIRKPDGRHILKMLPRFKLQVTGNKARDILDNTQALTGIIEDYVRRYPSQWVWIHRRWRRQPQSRNNHK